MAARLREQLKVVGQTLKRELTVYRLILKDPRTPMPAKVLLGLAVGYLLLPFDLLPDFLPAIGHLDDMLLVPVLVVLALRLIPREVIAGCRNQAGSMPNPGKPSPPEL